MKKTYIYLIHDPKSKAYKIGRSDNPLQRLSGLQTGNSNKLELLGMFRDNESTEAEIHEELQEFWIDGEWFKEYDDVVDIFLQYARVMFDSVSMYPEREYNPLPRAYRQMKVLEESMANYTKSVNESNKEFVSKVFEVLVKHEVDKTTT